MAHMAYTYLTLEDTRDRSRVKAVCGFRLSRGRGAATVFYNCVLFSVFGWLESGYNLLFGWPKSGYN